MKQDPDDFLCSEFRGRHVLACPYKSEQLLLPKCVGERSGTGHSHEAILRLRLGGQKHPAAR